MAVASHSPMPLSLNSEAKRLVSGHGLSRAAESAHSEGFSPRLLRRGLKPVGIIRFGTAEAVP